MQELFQFLKPVCSLFHFSYMYLHVGGIVQIILEVIPHSDCDQFCSKSGVLTTPKNITTPKKKNTLAITDSTAKPYIKFVETSSILVG